MKFIAFVATTLCVLLLAGLSIEARRQDDSRFRALAVADQNDTQVLLNSTLMAPNNESQISYGFSVDQNGIAFKVMYRPYMNSSAMLDFTVRIDGLVELLPQNCTVQNLTDAVARSFNFSDWLPIQVSSADINGTVNITALSTDGLVKVTAMVSQSPITFNFANRSYTLNPNNIKFTIDLNLTSIQYLSNNSYVAFRVRLESNTIRDLVDGRNLTMFDQLKPLSNITCLPQFNNNSAINITGAFNWTRPSAPKPHHGKHHGKHHGPCLNSSTPSPLNITIPALNLTNTTFDFNFTTPAINITSSDIADAFHLGNTDFINGILTWLNYALVNGVETNVLSSAALPCESGSSNATNCNSFLLAMNSTNPISVSFDPAVGVETMAEMPPFMAAVVSQEQRAAGYRPTRITSLLKSTRKVRF